MSDPSQRVLLATVGICALLLLLRLSWLLAGSLLSAALSLPLILPNGFPFLEQDFIIIIAAGLMVLTLLLGTIIIPYSLPANSANTVTSEQLEAHKLDLAAATLEQKHNINNSVISISQQSFANDAVKFTYHTA